MSSYLSPSGIKWNTIHILSPRRYHPALHDYITLPIEARTDNTLIRWIQSDTPINTNPRVHWALDDIYIGGLEVNPSQYFQPFDGFVKDDSNAYEFSPHGVIDGDAGVCQRLHDQGSVMVWEGTDKHSSEEINKKGIPGAQMFITNQIIVQKDYMLQFKVRYLF